VGGSDINEGTDFDRYVTVDSEDTDDEGEVPGYPVGTQPIGSEEVTKVGGVVEVAGVKCKRVENITRDPNPNTHHNPNFNPNPNPNPCPNPNPNPYPYPYPLPLHLPLPLP
jgi:hypothetical protein